MPRLSLLGLLFCSATLSAADGPLKIALYVGGGTSKGKANVELTLKQIPNAAVTTVTAEDVVAGKLKGFDVAVFPGGSGSGQARALGAEGREQVRGFVKGGGAYVGICAGAYLASRSYDWSLHVLDAEVRDRKHWARGFGDVELKLTPRGRTVLDVKDEKVGVYYHQGPLLAPGNDPEIPDYEPLALFETEIAKNGAPSGVMKGTTAVAAGRYGDGKVVCFSPHPEKREETRGLLRKSIDWIAKK